MTRKSAIPFVLLAAAVCAYFAWFAWPTIDRSSESVRRVAAFSIDEARHAEIVKTAIARRSMRLDFDSYGHLYFNATLIPLFLLDAFTVLSDRHIIVALRLVATLFAVGTVLVLSRLAWRHFGSMAGLLTCGFTCLVPSQFLYWSVTSHPDVPQVFFIAAALYFVCRFPGGERRAILAASICAGLAFSCKYSRAFLLPIIWVVATCRLRTDDRAAGQRRQSRSLFTDVRPIVLAIGVAAIALSLVLSEVFVARWFSVDGAIDRDEDVRLLRILRFLALAFGVALVALASLGRSARWLNRHKTLVTVVNVVAVSVAAFALAFAVASPFSLLRLQFIKGIVSESKHAAFGETFRGSPSGLEWLPLLADQESIGWPLLALCAVSALMALRPLSAHGKKALEQPKIILWLWCALYVGFLVARVRLYAARYLLPVVPTLLTIAAVSAVDIARLARARAGRRVGIAVTAALCLWLGATLAQAFGRVVELRRSLLTEEDTNPAIRAGDWMVGRYAPDALILWDQYSYVPPIFTNMAPFFSGTVEILKRRRPAAVILNERVAAAFSDSSLADQYRGGARDFRRKYDYYTSVKDGAAGYRLAASFGEFRVYEPVEGRRGDQTPAP